MKHLKRFVFFIIILIFIDLTVSIIYHNIAITFVKKNQFSIEKQNKSDCIILFFGDYDYNNHKLGEETLKRINHTFSLYKKNKIPYIICVGGSRNNCQFSGANEMCKYLKEKGIDENNLFYDTLSFDTKTNYKEACKLLDSNRFENPILISSDLHLFRISGLVDRNVYYSPHKNTNKSLFKRWKSINNEVIALIAYTFLPEKWYLNTLKKMRDENFKEQYFRKK